MRDFKKKFFKSIESKVIKFNFVLTFIFGALLIGDNIFLCSIFMIYIFFLLYCVEELKRELWDLINIFEDYYKKKKGNDDK